MPYTVNDSPAIVARIDADLAAVTDAVREADPALRSLVLTGGFARSEGAVLDGVPQNDYDLVAVRGMGRMSVPYARLGRDLTDRVGVHVDIAPVQAWRLRWASPSIFWYETALRGRVLWGADVLPRIPARSPDALEKTEALRLLVNRAAGLLLVTDRDDAHQHRTQAAKALLAAADVHLLAAGRFAPSQRERWDELSGLRRTGQAPKKLERLAEWTQWAYAFKTDPGRAESRDPRHAWCAGREAILDAVPTALRHARLRSLDAYARRDGVVDHLVYYRRARRLRHARRLALHPTGRVRVATLRLLEGSPDGKVHADTARRCLGRVGTPDLDPVRLLDVLRRATLQ